MGQTLTFLGATSNAASTVTANLNTSGLEGLGYGIRVAGISGSPAVQIETLSSPSGGLLETKRVSGAAAPGAVGTFTDTTNGAGSTAVTVSTTAGSKTITFSASPTTGGTTTDISLAGRVIRLGTGASTQYAVVETHTAASLTATIAVQAAATATGLASASTTTGNAYTTVPSTSTGAVTSYVTGDNLYVGAAAAGTYTFRVFADNNTDGIYQSNTDDTTPTFTLTVKDPTDAFALTAPSSVTAGTAGTMAKVTPGIDVTDIRGGSPSALGTVIATRLGIAITDNGSGGGVTGEGSGTTVVYSTADGFYRYLGSSSTQALGLDTGTPHTLGTALSFNSVAVTGATKTTEVASNSVSTLPLAVKSGQTTNVLTSSGVAQVRAGTANVTYTATAKDSGGAVLSGKDVTFTLTGTSGTTASTDLKANDATVPLNGQVVVTTDSDGIATLKVTSTKTADGNAYSVAATSGTASGTTITSTYFATAPYLVTSNNVAALVGGSATLAGKVVDRWGEPYSSSGLTAALSVTGGATPATGNYTIGSDGKFSTTVSDTASNTTPRTDSFTWTVSGATTQAGTKSLAWRTSITPGAATIDTTTIAGSSSDTAIPFTSSTTKVDLATSGAFSGDVETVKGTLKDTASTPAALPFASVTYTGSDGVYFYNSDNKLSKTMTAVTTSTGKLSYDGSTDGIRVLFTKSGDATITAKAGGVTKAVTVAVEASTEAYKVVAINVSGKPGTTITVQGTVKDVFENPATGRYVTLALSSLSAGNFSGTDVASGTAGFQVQTDDQGVWSTPFTSTSNQDGTVTLTVTEWNSGNSAALTANPTVNAAYAAAGLTIADGEYQDTSTIKVGVVALTLQSSAKLTYGSKYYARGALLSGTGADANADVDIYAKVPGGTYALIDSVKANAEGEFGVSEKISKSTYFLAKSGTASSTSSATRIYSGVVLTAKSNSKGHVTLSANGGPNATAYLYFYRVFSTGDTDYLGRKLSSVSGNGSATFKAPKGNRKYKVLYKAPGTTTGSDTVSVKVK